MKLKKFIISLCVLSLAMLTCSPVGHVHGAHSNSDHTSSCFENAYCHSHDGSSSSYGSCYSRNAICGSYRFDSYECSGCYSTSSSYNSIHTCGSCGGSGNREHSWSLDDIDYGETHGCGADGSDEIVAYNYKCTNYGCSATYYYKPYRYCSGCAELGPAWYDGSINGCASEGNSYCRENHGEYCCYAYGGSIGGSCGDCWSCGGDGECGRYTLNKYYCSNCGSTTTSSSSYHYYSNIWELTCSLTPGNWYNTDNTLATPLCDKVVTSLVPTNSNQTINALE